jgi:hypothetical protein
MPYNSPGGDNRFYASVHVGETHGFGDSLAALNAYVERVSALMRKGRPYSDLAVYLPLEDNRMRDVLPEAERRPSAKYHWELQHQRFPESTRGYRPLWVTTPFLREAEFREGRMRCGETSFRSLLVDVEWLDAEGLVEILRLAEAGLPVCVRGTPREPGFRKTADYGAKRDRLLSVGNVGRNLEGIHPGPPLVEGDGLPEFWCRAEGDDHLLFFAHPLSDGIRYPLRYGQSYCEAAVEKRVTVNLPGLAVPLTLRFEPYQSLLVRIDGKGKVRHEDIEFIPTTPSVSN